MSFISDLARAHERHEGYFPGSQSYRNNNPGNIRGPGGPFIVFQTYEDGFAALIADLKAKIFGTAGSVRRFMQGTGKAYEELTFQDYVSIYAPSADHNDPVNYCNALCRTLALYYLKPETLLLVLAQLIRGEISRVPDPPPPPMSLEQRLASAQNALKWATPERASMLRRLIDRIKDRFNQSS